MRKPHMTSLAVNHIHPAGIFLGLLEKQATGLTGCLPEVFPDVSVTSAWLGGDGESWERGPYYLDGLVPLAFLLENESLLARVETWINAILSSQREDGFFGPRSNDDWWPRFVAAKAVTTYQEATGSTAALSFLVRFCDHMRANIETRPPEFWGFARGMEAFPAVLLVWEKTGNDVYLDLLRRLENLTYDWNGFFRAFPYSKPTSAYLNRTFFLAAKPVLALLDQLRKKQKVMKPRRLKTIRKANRKHSVGVYLTTHGVNLAMAVKYPVYSGFLRGDARAQDLLTAVDTLLSHHGTAVGVFSSDEHLNGPSPDKGIELCTVVELMHSLEETLRLTGDPIIADRLEFLAQNALPAMITPDLCAHQYLQQTNQPQATVKHRPFYDAGPRATTFGVAPNYGCCAVNMHQGFPKYVQAAVMTDGDEAVVFLFVAGTYDIPFADGNVIIEIVTGYPFEDQVTIKVVAMSALTPKSLRIRRPYQAAMTVDDVTVPGLESIVLTTAMAAGNAFSLRVDFPVTTLHNVDGTASVRRGGLLFARKLAAKENELGGTPPFHDREFVSHDRTRYALILENGQVAD
ncbi:MAG: beta-L-arabinofuranosidase domain-containing protein, partial [bacterium]